MAKRRSTRRRGGGIADYLPTWLGGTPSPAPVPEPVPTGQSSPVAAPPATTMGGKKRKTRRGGRHRRGHSKSWKIYGH